MKYIFLILLYCFLFFVVKIIYSDIYRATRLSSRAKGQPHLVTLQGGIPQKSFALDYNVLIGRSLQNDILLEDDFVSQKHARIFKKSNVFFLEDLGSTNGTYLGSQKVTEPTPLEPGDIIRIGQTVFRFE